jgi:hypothetical protein
VTYRDDRDADQARITALEADLARANDRVAELENRRSQALVLAGSHALAPGMSRSPATRWLGAPTKLQLSRAFDKALSADHFEELVERIREMTGDPGRTELLKSSLTWWSSSRHNGPGPSLSITVTARNDKTVLTATDNLGALVGGLWGGLGGGAGGGGLGFVIPAAIAVPALAPVFIIGWLGGVYAGTRAIYKRSARKRAEELQRLFDVLAGDIAEKL